MRGRLAEIAEAWAACEVAAAEEGYVDTRATALGEALLRLRVVITGKEEKDGDERARMDH